MRCHPNATVRDLRLRIIEKVQPKTRLNLSNFKLCTKADQIVFPDDMNLFLDKTDEKSASSKPLYVAFLDQNWFSDPLKIPEIKIKNNSNQNKCESKEDEAAPHHKEQKNVTLQQKKRSKKLSDFLLIKVIGRGSFGKVLLAREKETREIYAIKVLQKRQIVKKKHIEHLHSERSVLALMKNPFIVKLHYAFQSKSKLYFVLTYCPGGELFFHLSKKGRFSETQARFYGAEILLALGDLHKQDIIYRDLKPENVLLDAEGHVCLTDFGLSKQNITGHSSTHSFCGTPAYLAPEVIRRNGHGKATDWWLYGSFIFEMLTGSPPFYNCNSQKQLFSNILTSKIYMPKYISKEAKSLLKGFLQRNPLKRLGSSKDVDEIKEHVFFKGLDWKSLYRKEIPPPFKPKVTSYDDTRNFDKLFTSSPISRRLKESPSKSCLKFDSFSFVHTPPKKEEITLDRNFSSPLSNVTKQPQHKRSYNNMFFSKRIFSSPFKKNPKAAG